MSLLKVSKLTKEFDYYVVLKNVGFSVERGDKIALVGHNGAGKTTLLKILAGLEEKDLGRIELARGVKMAYLPQDTSLLGGETVAEYFAKNNERAPQYRIEMMLQGFGLSLEILNNSLDSLSSGQKTKVALIGILLQDADLLLLDEPTNNLDLPALIWLEQFLQQSAAAALIISHDRRFLDRVTSKIMEIDWHTHELTITKGSYSSYIERELKRLARHRQEYEAQQAEVSRLLDRADKMIERANEGREWKSNDNDKMQWGFMRDRAKKSARQAKAVVRRARRLDKIEAPIEREPMDLSLKVNSEGGAFDIEAKNVITGYDSGFTIGPISLEIRYGKRVGLIGLNGSGKSTLLKTLKGELSVKSGEVLVGAGVKFADLMQEHESLPRERSMLDFLKDKTGALTADINSMLARFGFDPERSHNRIEYLSPGERARLLLALFTMSQINTLILDEPTNHLDIEALEALEEALASFSGTMIVVSHDRHFLDQVRLDSLYLLEDGRISEVQNYEQYIAEAETKAKKLIRVIGS